MESLSSPLMKINNLSINSDNALTSASFTFGAVRTSWTNISESFFTFTSFRLSSNSCLSSCFSSSISSILRSCCLRDLN